MEIQNITGPDVMRNSFTPVPEKPPVQEEKPKEPEIADNEKKGISIDTYA